MRVSQTFWCSKSQTSKFTPFLHQITKKYRYLWVFIGYLAKWKEPAKPLFKPFFAFNVRVGGEMVRKMIKRQEETMAGK